jgi:phosphatidyl-myo-inositol dimannoside synthase
LLIRPRVLVVAPCLHGADGISVLSRQLIRALEHLGCSVESWVLADVDRSDLIDDVSRVTAYRANGRVGLARHGLWSSCREHFDRVLVTHLHLLPVVAGHLARGTPLAVSLAGIECWVPLGGVRASLLSRADALCAISSYTAARFVAANPAFAARTLHICPPSVPEDITWSDPPIAPSVLAVGRLSNEERYKGHDALLNVWPSVVAAIPGARLVFAGEGSDRARLERRIDHEGLASSVRSMGLVTRAELKQAYAACRVFALPSNGEGFGIVFLEAMAAGRPCIACPGGAEDVIEHGRTGLLVEPGDEHALRETIVRLLTDDELCRAMGAEGHQRATRDFSHAALTARLSNALGMNRARVALGC